MIVDGEVVWQSEQGAESMFHYQAGLRFLGLEQTMRAKLDSFVIETIENRLLSLGVNALDSDFVRREQLIL
jgi:hypothetical protein